MSRLRMVCFENWYLETLLAKNKRYKINSYSNEKRDYSRFLIHKSKLNGK